jgi:hypothetical protein
VGEDKYNATVASMIGLLKYGGGMPFNRLDGMQSHLQIPLPASTQWEIVSGAVPDLTPVHQELIRQAAQGEVVYNDDTGVKILQWMGDRARRDALAEATGEDGELDKKSRTGKRPADCVCVLRRGTGRGEGRGRAATCRSEQTGN